MSNSNWPQSLIDKAAIVKEDLHRIYESGKEKQYRNFWDKFQNEGKLTDYSYAFAGKGWKAPSDTSDKNTYKPYHPINADNAEGMFYKSGLIDASGTPIIFTANCKFLDKFIQGSDIEYLPSLDVTNITSMREAFADSAINELTLENINKDCNFEDAFKNASNLEETVFSGEIGNDIDFSDSHDLTKASIENIIDTLSDEVTNKTAVFSSIAVTNAFPGDSSEYAAKVVDSQGIETYFSDTLEGALSYATEADTVYLLKSASINAPIDITKKTTIHLNGKNIFCPKNKYTFNIADNTTLNIIGQGSIYTNANNINLGFVNFLSESSILNIQSDSDDKIFVLGNGGTILNIAQGQAQFTYVDFYTPTDTEEKIFYDMLIVGKNAKCIFKNSNIYKQSFPGTTGVPDNTQYIFRIYDSSSILIDECNFTTSTTCFYVAKDLDNPHTIQHKIMEINNSTINSSHPRPNGTYGFSSLIDDNGNPIGWDYQGGGGRCCIALFEGNKSNLQDDPSALPEGPKGTISINTCTLKSAWRAFVSYTSSQPPATDEFMVQFDNSTISANSSHCGVELTQELFAKALSERKLLDGEKSSTYVYRYMGVDYNPDNLPANGYAVPDSGQLIVRSSIGKYSFTNCNLETSSISYFWSGEEYGSAAAEQFYINDGVKFNKRNRVFDTSEDTIPRSARSFTTSTYGDFTNFDVGLIYPKEETFKYGVVQAYDELDAKDSGVNIVSRYQTSATANNSDGFQQYLDGNTTIMPIPMYFVGNGFDGRKCLKVLTQKPNSSYANYYTYPTSGSIKLVTDSFIDFYGHTMTNEVLRLKNNTGYITTDGVNSAIQTTGVKIYSINTALRFSKITYTIYVATAGKFLYANALNSSNAIISAPNYVNINLRFYDKSGTNVISPGIRFTRDSSSNPILLGSEDEKTFTLSDTANQWYKIRLVFDLNADKMYGYANLATADDSTTPFTTWTNLLKDSSGTSRNIYSLQGLRFYINKNSVLPLNHTLMFDNFTIETTSQIDASPASVLNNSVENYNSDNLAKYDTLYGSLKYYAADSSGTITALAVYTGAAEAETQTYSVIKQSLIPTKLDLEGVDTLGGYLKWEIQNPTPGSLTDENTFYNTWGNPKADSSGHIDITNVTNQGTLDSHMLLAKKLNIEDSTGLLPLLDASGNLLYHSLILELDIKTETTFLANGSYLTVRMADETQALIGDNRLALKIMNTDDRKNTYLKTNIQSNIGFGGHKMGTPNRWYHIMIVINFNADPKYNTAHYFCDGKYIGADGFNGNSYLFGKDSQAITPAYFDALRFNIQVNTSVFNDGYYVGDNICFDNVRISTWDGKTFSPTSNITEAEKLEAIPDSDSANTISDEWQTVIANKSNWTILLSPEI